jgi:phosphatidylglycerophosphate synthase
MHQGLAPRPDDEAMSPSDAGLFSMSLWTRMRTWLSTPARDGQPRSRAVRWIVPNSLSLLRIGLAFAFPWVPAAARGGMIAAAAASDVFDGRLSRALHGTSTLGQILDPVADKLFVGMVLITLVMQHELTLLELLLIGFRDLAVLSGSAWSIVVRGWGSLRHMPPSILGKLATAGQFSFLLSLTLASDRSTLFFRLVEAAAAVLSILAGIDYLFRTSAVTGGHETA